MLIIIVSLVSGNIGISLSSVLNLLQHILTDVMIPKRIFVTVGTTKFPKLIDTITQKDILDTLIALKCEFVQIQTGNDFSSVHLDPELNLPSKFTKTNDSVVLQIEDKIILKYDKYFDDFENQIDNCDLIISHAGAGTCLEVLHKKKPLVIVINEDLMDNHQTELAEALQKNGYLFYCTCSTLKHALTKDFSKLKPYPQPQKFVFSSYLDKCMGFSI